MEDTIKPTRKYLDLNRIESRGAILNIISSARGPGKTSACQGRALDRFFKKGEHFMYIRRNEDELNSTKRSHFNAILGWKYNNKYEMKITGSEYFIRETRPDGIYGKELKEWYELNPWKLCGYAIAVSKQQQFKSGGYPNVTTMYYDEFIPDNPWSRENPSEVSLFLKLVETVARDRQDVKIFMLSNTGFVTNPYYTYYNIRSEDLIGREFVSRLGGDVCFWYYRYDDEDREFVNRKISSRISMQVDKDSSIEGKFSDIQESFIVRDRPKNAVPWGTFSAMENNVFRVFQYEDGFWIDEGKKITTVEAWTFSQWELAVGSVFNQKAIKKLQAAAARRTINFATPDTRARFLKKLEKS